MDHIERLCELYGAPTTLQELCESVHKFINYEETVLYGIGFRIAYSKAVTNTHSAPKNGEENWGGVPGKARGYPGWRGRIWAFWKNRIQCDHPLISLKNLGIHTGTGGYGIYNCPFETDIGAIHRQPSLGRCYPLSHTLNIYEDDYPSLVLGDVLGIGDNTNNLKHIYKSIIRRSDERINEKNQ